MTTDDPSDLTHPRTEAARALAALVHRFLRGSEARDRAALEKMATSDFSATFPRGVVHASIGAWMDSSTKSFERVRKIFERFDVVAGDAPDSGTVYAFGQLTGRFRGGDSFDGTRFIDRFEVENGRIRRQTVWNDLSAENGGERVDHGSGGVGPLRVAQ